MTANGWIQIALYCALIIAIARPLGGYITRVFNGERTFLSLSQAQAIVGRSLAAIEKSPGTTDVPSDREPSLKDSKAVAAVVSSTVKAQP